VKPVDEVVEENKTGLLSIHPSWTRVRLREVADVLNGFAFSSTRFSQTEGLPLIRIRDISSDTTETRYAGDYESVYLISRGDLLVGMDGDFNCALWKGEQALLNQRVCKVVPTTELYQPKFLFYSLSPYLQAVNHATSSLTVKHLSSATVKELPLPLPPLSEQRRIVAKIEELFSDLDAGVAALERVRANLKRYRAAVLKAAVEGKLTEDWRAQHPDTEPASVLLERILTERRRQWEKDQLTKFAQAGKQPPKGWQARYQEPVNPQQPPPTLPDGWAWRSLEHLSSSVRPITYGILKPGAFSPQGIMMLRIVDIASGAVSFEGVHRVSQSLSDEYARTLLFGGEVLISLVGSIGLVAYFPGSTEAVNLHRNVGMIAPSSGVSGKYLRLVMSSHIVQKQIEGARTGALQPLLNLSDVRRLGVPITSTGEQEIIVERMESILTSLDQVEADVEVQLKRAARLRQGILKRAFEGRLVPQDPTDEPAEKLLEGIKQEIRQKSNSRITTRLNDGKKKESPVQGQLNLDKYDR
jgi:type I restriction enzyme S subunit